MFATLSHPTPGQVFAPGTNRHHLRR